MHASAAEGQCMYASDHTLLPRMHASSPQELLDTPNPYSTA